MRNDSINVSIIDPVQGTRVFTFPGNFSDGFRHLFQSIFHRTDEPILILVDSEKKYLDGDIHLYLSHAIGFYFGGVPVGLTEKNKLFGPDSQFNKSVVERYKGCMSSKLANKMTFLSNSSMYFLYLDPID